ncbi:uncharacterized protein DNG_07680 [Cephalotrichum gorgonifer]|uniref:Heterokaryon incompatibility domain-containing protein n=1 Tax=Cephalotrichum gorgonifer TaxID=2041049 RepID=A0AAE8SXN0_9PEZI|nr:uncharacterized protein DNG_07680 [Cephalotrichum gorgonifer]
MDEMMHQWEWQGSERNGGQRRTLAAFLAGVQAQHDDLSSSRRRRCSSCSDFDTTHGSRDLAASERYAIYNLCPTLSQIRATADAGCKRCQVIAQAHFYLGGPTNGPVRLKFLPTSLAMSTPLSCIEVFPGDGSLPRAMGFPPPGKGRHRYPEIEADECFEAMTLAINDCILNHADCRPPAIPIRPARLVEVPEEPGMPIKVITTPEDAEYTALSHCWGTSPLLRLLKKAGSVPVIFGWDELPRSFQDVCKVTRKLNIQYVWIDSLCIVQDDEADWEAEAAKMGSIYEGSYVTISAMDARASVDGFLYPRYITKTFNVDNDGKPVRFTARQYNTDMFNSKFFYCGDTPEHQWLMRPMDMEQKYMNPIQLRGWCFQERLLAKRILHFKRYEFFLECNMGCRCECSGMKSMRDETLKSFVNMMLKDNLTAFQLLHAGRLQRKVAMPLGFDRELEAPSANPDVRLMQTWELLVECYSRTSFTHQEDVLPALGSLARIFQAKKPDWTYVAGLWKEQLTRNLMWTTQDSMGIGTKVARRKGGEGASIAIYDNLGDGYCGYSEQLVEICKDLSSDVWEATTKVDSGMETMQRVQGFDMENERLPIYRDEDQPVAIMEPLVLLRVFSGYDRRMRGAGAATLMLRKVSDDPTTYRRVGLRKVKNRIFAESPEVDIRVE